jgi:hypothetical protein
MRCSYQLPMIAPIVTMATNEQAHSKSHKLAFLPIQITSMEEDVTKNPSQSQSAHITPPHNPTPPRYGDEEAKRYMTART